ncbi:MAG TPA: hypothetical protein DIT13_15945 [Verrucomicrobiales bacterium]|nr:hypothetical protein [Verrucomicrobiales bacterium]HRJ08952.1 hypothetical protein [Prosthecobacter sp.]HRK15504.1 hypothetical protein [Prosthecobacter sp.]
MKAPIMADPAAETTSMTAMEQDLFPHPDPNPAGLTAETSPAWSPDSSKKTNSGVFPRGIQDLADKLRKAMNDPSHLSQAFAEFCTAAYVKPEWAGAASEFLAELFEGREEHLAEMAHVPDLIIELATGHYAVTFMAASVWAAKGDVARMSRLAEALAATQSKLSGVEVVDVMLALAASLAISRYPRAEQLVNIAAPQAAPEHEEALAEARLWLAAGRAVRACDQEVRDMWEQRLRRPQHPWTWEGPVERAALTQLADQVAPRMEAESLFQAVLPAGWWELAMRRAEELIHYDAALRQKKCETHEDAPPPAEPPPMVIGRPIVIWRLVPFCFGGLVGAWAFALGIYFGPFDLVRPGASVNEVGAAADGQTTPGGEFSQPGEEGEPPSASVSADVRQGEHPDSLWRKEESRRLLEKLPELAASGELLKHGGWEQHRAMLEGEEENLSKNSPEYEKLLVWLHLSPVSDDAINTRVPGLLAALKPDSDTLDLWEKLIYPGSPNAPQIREAARRQHHENTQSWSPTQRSRLSRIGWDTP